MSESTPTPKHDKSSTRPLILSNYSLVDPREITFVLLGAKKRRRKQIVRACLAVAVALLIGGLGFVAGRQFQPSNAKSPKANTEAWSHGELIDHLRSKGLVFSADGRASGWGGPPTMTLTFADEDEEREIYVILKTTPQEAKEFVSPEGARGFSWGRFGFVISGGRLQRLYGEEPERLARAERRLKQIQQALP